MSNLFPLFSLLLCIPSSDTGPAPGKIHADVTTALETSGKVNIVVTFKSGISTALKSATLLQRSVVDRAARNEAILHSLEKHSDGSQAGVLRLLNTARSPQYYKSYKSSNIVYIRDATKTLINQIAEDTQVAKIREEPIIHHVAFDESEMAEMERQTRDGTKEDDTPEWSLKQIQVPEAWEELEGRKGEGVVVGSIDGGADVEHEALKSNYVGEYGWFDPMQHSLVPRDDSRSHGSHVNGIMVGSRGIGVAPGAKWMTCAACDVKCKYEHLRDCIQWMECPTLPDGTKKDCSKAPRIINNSWVTIRGDEDFNEDVLRWRALGIIPVWSISNNGPFCESTAAPAELPFVIAVGGNQHDGSWYGRSGVGPGPKGGIKPDVVAPGKGILSVCGGGKNRYCWNQGTSMAAPYVAGVVALLMTRNLKLTYEEAYTLLTQNTDPECPVKRSSLTCAEQTEEAVPNNFCGFGRVNALKAVRAQTKLLLEAKNRRNITNG